MQPISLYNIYKRATIAFVVTAILVLSAAVGHKNVFGVSENNNGVVEYESGSIEAMETQEIAPDQTALYFDTTIDSEYIWVPMPEGTVATDVAIENHYMDRQLWISVSGADEAFYKQTKISGDLTDITGGSFTSADEKLILKLDLEHIYEYTTIFEDGVLYIEKVIPNAQYDKIVVIDPAGANGDFVLADNSMSPAAICVDIAAKLKTLLETDGIRVYVTNLDEQAVEDEACLDLSKEVKPDMYVRIETSVDEDSKIYGTKTVYNGTYFIPGFGSTELADLLESNVTTSIGGKADGLMEATGDDGVILNSTVPAATVKVGYYTNMQENILLNRDDYRTKIAQGMYKAIMTGFGDE